MVALASLAVLSACGPAGCLGGPYDSLHALHAARRGLIEHAAPARFGLGNT